MPFNSYEFVFAFLPAAVAGYWLLVRFAGRTFAIGWLLLASIVFYARANLASLAIIVPSILLDYVTASMLLRLDPSRERLRNLLFASGVLANIAALCYFKYRNFFLETANAVLATHFGFTEILLPLGLSFLTFQKIAFLADVHSGQVKSVRCVDFLLFALFFPRTIAGPIVRYAEILPQLEHPAARALPGHLAVGVCLFSIGLFKKAVIADSIAQFVPAGFEPPADASGPVGLLTAWTSVLAYTFQLYFDFSGYSDMALGVARMAGVQLPMNFNSPFRATSIIEFWGRWHITLTRFLTAYVYTPLVLRRTRLRLAKGKPVLRGKRSTLPAIATLVGLPTLITMVISGFWHGAGWQFIAWGALHGIYLAVNQGWRMLRPRFWPEQASYDRVMKPVGLALTFGAVVVGLVFFRAASLQSAWSVLRSMSGAHGILSADVRVLQHVGVELPWHLFALFQPLTPLLWIGALFLAVQLLPNSLEILRRFQPALDFPAASAGTVQFASVSSGRLGSAWAASHRIARDGAMLSARTAIIAAILFVLGVLALNRGGAFLYGQF